MALKIVLITDMVSFEARIKKMIADHYTGKCDFEIHQTGTGQLKNEVGALTKKLTGKTKILIPYSKFVEEKIQNFFESIHALKSDCVVLLTFHATENDTLEMCERELTFIPTFTKEGTHVLMTLQKKPPAP